MTEQDMHTWVAALRSGTYIQCDGRLHDKESGGYCCLGVYLHAVEQITAPDVGYSDDAEGANGDLYGTIDFNLEGTGIERVILTNMNDVGKPFSAIADYIETNWKPTP